MAWSKTHRPSPMGLNLTTVPSVDRSMWSLVPLTNCISTTLTRIVSDRFHWPINQIGELDRFYMFFSEDKHQGTRLVLSRRVSLSYIYMPFSSFSFFFYRFLFGFMNLGTKTPANNTVITEDYNPSAAQASAHRAASFFFFTVLCYPLRLSAFQ